MSVARTLLKLQAFQTTSLDTAPYANEAGTFTNARAALDWIFAVLYPNTQDSVDTVGDLPPAGNTINDYRVVLDDGDGKAAGYRWEQREGEVAPSWHKVHDMDWSSDTILSAMTDITNELYVSKNGRMDLDETGTPITGIFEGQTITGGSSSGNLTLNANASDLDTLPENQTGYIQFHGNVRPTGDASVDLGSTSFRFNNLFIAGSLGDGSQFVSVDDIVTAYQHAVTVASNPHGTSYNDLSAKLGTLTLSGDASGSADLSTSGGKTLAVTVVDDSHNHTTGTISDFTAASYAKIKSTLQNNDGISWTFNDGAETATPTVAITTAKITDIDSPAANKIMVGNAAGTDWVASSGTIELTGGATGTATYNSTTDKWSIATTVASSSLSGVTDVDLTNKTITSISVANPAVVTRSGHGLRTGDKVRVFNSVTTPNINNTAYTVTVIDANTFSIPVNVTAYTSGGYFIPTGGQLLYNPTTAKFEVAKEFEEIRLGELQGLTEDVLSIYVAKDGRSGGQTIQGGVSASEILTLESTNHATKGTIQFKDSITPAADAAYSGGWTGTDVGSSSKRVNNLYIAGELKGGRVENVGALPSSSGTTVGRLVTYSGKLWMDTGAAYVKAGSSDLVVATKTANYTTVEADDVILVDATSGNITITLITAVGYLKRFTVKKIDSSSNTVTIDANGSQTIDGALTYVISDQYLSISMVSDNSNWYIV